MAPPLTGLKVVDFTRVIAGPVAAMILSDLGAEIVKLEHPKGGDDTRGYRPPEFKGISAAFLSYNRGKQSVAVDLATEAGCKAARALVDQADVVIENFSTGVMAKYGLDYESVKRPELVYCSTSAYGRDGPFMKRPGYDPVVQAESGFQSLTGHADSEPVRTAIPMTDVTTGLNGAMAILAALWWRKKTGLGQFVEVPLYDTGLSNTERWNWPRRCMTCGSKMASAACNIARSLMTLSAALSPRHPPQTGWTGCALLAFRPHWCGNYLNLFPPWRRAGGVLLAWHHIP